MKTTSPLLKTLKTIFLGLFLSCFLTLWGCEKNNPPINTAKIDTNQQNTTVIQHLQVQNPAFFAALYNEEQVFISGSDGTIIQADINLAATKTIQWSAVKTQSSDNILAIASAPNNAQLVAVGENGLILHSTKQGKNWQRKISHTDKKLTAVTFDSAHQTWIAGGDQGVLLRGTTTDTEWTKIDTRHNANLSNIYYLAEQKILAAIGENGLLMLSRDGGNQWQTIALPTSAALIKLAAIDRTIIIACADGTLLRSEKDWEDWQLINTGSSAYLTDLLYDAAHNTLLVISAEGEIIISDNGGKTWAPVADTNEYLTDILALKNSEKLIVAGANGTQLISDNGGRTWSKLPPLTSASIHGLIDIGNRRVVAYGEGGLLMQSDNAGENWQLVHAPVTGFVHQLIQLTTGNWLAVGAKGLLLTSNNQGQDWQPIDSAQQSSDYFFSIIRDKKTDALITAGPPGTVLTSNDQGQSWHVRFSLGDINQGYFHQLLSNDKGTIVALAGPGNTHYSHNSGTIWAASEHDNNKHLFAGIYDATHRQFVAIGQAGAIQISQDGKKWTSITAHISKNLHAIYSTKSTVWIGGEEGLLLRSNTAGSTWETINTNTRHTILSIVALRSGTLLATGNNGLILRLANSASEWQIIANPTQDVLRKPVQDPATEIIYLASRSGAILYSRDDGQHWATMEPITQASIKTLAIDSASNALLGGGERLVRIPLLNPE